MEMAEPQRRTDGARKNADERVLAHFAGKNSKWRRPYEALVENVHAFGPDVSISPTHAYIGLLRNGRKFGILAISTRRLDIGLKLKGTPAAGRFEDAARWNSMVTHRVRITSPEEIDREILSRLREAYERAVA